MKATRRFALVFSLLALVLGVGIPADADSTPAAPALPQAVVDALTKAAASKQSADQAATAAKDAAAALVAAQQANQAAIDAASKASSQLAADRQALDAVIDSYFQVSTPPPPAAP